MKADDRTETEEQLVAGQADAGLLANIPTPPPMSDDDAKLIASIDKIVLPTNLIEDALWEINESIRLSQMRMASTNVILFGNSGAGKTTLSKILLSQHGAVIDKVPGFTIRTDRAHYMSIPSEAMISTVLTVMLKSLGDPHPTTGFDDKRELRLIELLVNTGTILVILDELQHLLDLSKRQKLLNWLKTLTDTCGITFVLIGTPACQAILEDPSAKELSRRFETRLSLGYLSINQEKGGTFPEFIRSFAEEVKESLQLISFPDFQDEMQVLRGFAITGGAPGAVGPWLRLSLKLALGRLRTREVTWDHLVRTGRSAFFRPFRVVHDDVFEIPRNALVDALSKGGHL